MSRSLQQQQLFLGDQAPDFESETTMGHIKFSSFIQDKWAILFSHPKDLLQSARRNWGAAQLEKEWSTRGVAVIALSCDSVESHKKWVKDIEAIHNCKVFYPIIADDDRKIACLYGMLDKSSSETELPLTVRSVFFIAPDKSIKATLSYPASTGRNFDEILRILDSLQLTAKYKVATPADWVRGQQCVIPPTLSDDKATDMFGEFKTIRPYLRMTNDPSSCK